jgi:hypothetical protein
MKSVLDDALEGLRHTGPEAADGAPNHGPMAAEALVALGCDDAVPQWVATGIAVRWDPAAQPPRENCEQTGGEGAQ